MSSIQRSRRNKIVAGVLGGFAEHYGWSATRLRIIFVVVSILSAGFPGTVVYAALWFLLPPAEQKVRRFRVNAPTL